MAPSGRIGPARLTALLGSWHGGRPASADLAAALRLLVLDARLPAGTRLPSERELAAATGTSRTLTTAAYDRLRADGLLASARGAGSWTTLPDGCGRRDRSDARGDDDAIDLVAAAPPAPPAVATALDAVRPALAGLLGGAGYSPRGLPELRERIAERFAARGLPTTPDQIMVTAGAQHAFSLALRALVAPGERVLVEQPAYPNVIDAVRGAHAQPVPVPVDPDRGWDLDGIEAALRRANPALAYAVLDHHNPTGLRLDDDGRRRLAALLRRTRTPVVVDETQVDLALDGGGAAGDGYETPLAACGAGDLVITTGSASKTLWGGLRLGWLRASRELVDRLLVARTATDLGAPVIEQLVLAELLADHDALRAERVAGLRERCDVLRAALARHCPSWIVRVPPGGQSLWCELDAPASTRLSIAAAARGVAIAPGARFGVHGGLERWVRVPHTLAPEVLRDAAARLGDAWRAVTTSGGDPAGYDVPPARPLV